MNRPFTEADNGRRFSYPYVNRSGRLEYPLTDPGTALPGEAILWFDTPQTSREIIPAGWAYVLPVDVDPEETK